MVATGPVPAPVVVEMIPEAFLNGGPPAGEIPPVVPALSEEEATHICQLVGEARRQADDVRKGRLSQNKVNQAAFMARQDWSYKQPGQSREFLPRVPLATEQISNYVKRSLTDFGDWFQVELPKEAQISADDARAWLRQELEMMHRVQQGRLDFATTISDAVKTGLLQSLAILKVHGRMVTQRQWAVETLPGASPIQATPFPGDIYPPMGALPGMPPAVPPGPMNPVLQGSAGGGPGPTLPPGPGLPGMPPMGGAPPMAPPPPRQELRQRDVRQWHLLIDLIDPEDYYPDPTGSGMFEIQRAERDLADVKKMSEPGPNGEPPIYDPAVVAELEMGAAGRWDDAQRRQLRGEADPGELKWRPRVTLDEYWGSITDEDGNVVHENIVCVVANEKHLIRPPEPNPFWHGQSPFVVAPLMRVPFSVWHKALFDAAVGLNLSMNELYSLMLDGALASVWGTRTVRPGMLEDPRQISNGVPQGATLVVKDEAPAGVKVFEQVAQGTVPQESMALFQMSSQEFQGATLLSDVQRAQTPPPSTTATATSQVVAASATFFDGVVRDLEDKLIEPVLWKAWCCLLQNAEDVRASDVQAAMGPQQAVKLSRMSPAERYVTMAQGARFKVTGVSAVSARQQQFQKMMMLLQAVGSNPLMYQAFVGEYSMKKIINGLIRSLNIDPRTIELDEEEKMQQMIGSMMAQGQMGGAMGGPGGPPPPPQPQKPQQPPVPPQQAP